MSTHAVAPQPRSLLLPCATARIAAPGRGRFHPSPSNRPRLASRAAAAAPCLCSLSSRTPSRGRASSPACCCSRLFPACARTPAPLSAAARSQLRPLASSARPPALRPCSRCAPCRPCPLAARCLAVVPRLSLPAAPGDPRQRHTKPLPAC
nr:angiomotin-like [Aegilops tauschii subsp. strangulata]